jgi:hypothetical protein
MLNFEDIANQLRADGHYQMADAIFSHGVGVNNLNDALKFKEQCATDSTALETGARKDAFNWVFKAAAELCNDKPISSE